uniref:(northern house mosquito) hypothetical protein n=1 Tax=Culex pipiens TaxID=7175 RepID=A0A8D8FKY1_CULPI
MSKMAKVHVHRWKVDHQQPPLPPVWYCRIYLNEGNLSCIGPIRISRCRRSRCLETPASPAKDSKKWRRQRSLVQKGHIWKISSLHHLRKFWQAYVRYDRTSTA